MSRTALLFCMVAVGAWGVGAVVDKILMSQKGLSPWTAVMMKMILATIIISIYALATGSMGEIRAIAHMPSAQIARIVAAVIGTAVFATVVGQLSYYYALQQADASRVIPITSTYPLIAALVGWLVFREHFRATLAAGALLIAAGVALLQFV